MKRLILILLAIIVWVSTWATCSYFHPEIILPAKSTILERIHKYDEDVKWDYMKHFCYCVDILFIASGSLFERVEKYEKFVTLFTYGFVFGMVIPALCDWFVQDKDFHWWDLIFISIGFYGGLKDIFSNAHKTIGLFVLNCLTLFQAKKLTRKTYLSLCLLMK